MSISINHDSKNNFTIHTENVLSNRAVEKEGKLWALFQREVILNNIKKKNVLNLLEGILGKEEWEISALSKKIGTSKSPISERMTILTEIIKIPKDQRKDTVTQASLLFSHMTSHFDRIKILQTVVAFPQDERDEAIKLLNEAFDPKFHSLISISFLKMLAKIPKDQRNDIVIKGKEFFNNINNPFLKKMILEEIRNIPQNERDDVINKSKELFPSGIVEEDIIPTLKKIAKIPFEEREDILKLGRNLFFEPDDRKYKFVILKGICIIPVEERSILARQESINEIEKLSTIFYSPVEIFYLLSKQSQKYKNLSWKEEEVPKYQKIAISSLEQIISDPEFPPTCLLNIAKFIYKNYIRDLSIHEEHPLFQFAIEILSVNTEEPKNPFSLYKKLQQLQKEPSTFAPVTQNIEGFSVAVTIPASKTVTINRADLPSEATVEAWSKLTKDLKDKIEDSPQAEEALSNYGTSLAEIWEGSLGDSYLSYLLSLSGERVSFIEAKFKAIFASILAEKSAPEEAKIFTAQEEALIHTAISIQSCQGGKQEGIDMMYRLLNPHYHYSVTLAEHGEKGDLEATAIQFTAEVIKGFIADQFRGATPFMQQLTSTKDINQGVHQSIYVKNMIGHLVGLDHDLVFDKHTQLLYDTLLERTRDEILEIFFKHVTPETMAVWLMKIINEDFRKYGPIIDPLMNNDYLNLQDDDLSMCINKRGAVHLLQMTGYFGCNLR